MFRIGQKVVCVDASDTQCVVEGNIYEVSAVGRKYLCLVWMESDAVRSTQLRGMCRTRFRPVVEKKTDISCFTEILRRETIDDGPVVAKPRTRVTSDSGLSHD